MLMSPAAAYLIQEKRVTNLKDEIKYLKDVNFFEVVKENWVNQNGGYNKFNLNSENTKVLGSNSITTFSFKMTFSTAKTTCHRLSSELIYFNDYRVRDHLKAMFESVWVKVNKVDESTPTVKNMKMDLTCLFSLATLSLALQLNLVLKRPAAASSISQLISF